jgi:hypothetical protein
MADIFADDGVYQGTYITGTVETDPVFQICAVANINAANQFEGSFWITRNGERIDSDLGSASYRIRNKTGALVSGLSASGLSPDVNGYFYIPAVDASLLYDLNHYILEIEIPVDGVEKASSIGLVHNE